VCDHAGSRAEQREADYTDRKGRIAVSSQPSALSSFSLKLPLIAES
jgi:hypothetical protein